MEQKNWLERLYQILGYDFKDKGLIITALTHSSYANESKESISHNERLEFLGDSVLELVISDYLYKTYPCLSEGSLSKLRAGIVSEQSLSQIAASQGLGQFLRLGKGEENTGGRTRISILADTMESVIGAIYLDSDLTTIKKYILQLLEPSIDLLINGKGYKDYKTDLQELLQSKSSLDIIYEIIGENGPDHNKEFIAQVRHGDQIIGKGSGRSKKEAEQQAARVALTDLKNKI